jgi:hypothetical protein
MEEDNFDEDEFEPINEVEEKEMSFDEEIGEDLDDNTMRDHLG